MHTEANEVAESIARLTARRPANMNEARAIVREWMPDEAMTVIDNTAEALLRTARKS